MTDARPVAPPTNPHSDLPHAPRDRDFPAAMAARVMREVSRVCDLATEAESLEILLALSGRLAALNPAPRPFTPQIDAKPNAGHYATWGGGCSSPGCADPSHTFGGAKPDAADAFPGIFAGATGGDFGGLPLAPGEVTARVPELAVQLSGIAETLAVAHHSTVWHAELKSLATDAARRLHAIADEIAAEAGVQ